MVHPVVSIKYQYRFTDDFGSFRIHFAYGDDTVECCPASGPGICQIHFPVFIPKGSWVYHSTPGFHQYGLFPFSGRVFGLYHKDAVVGVAPVDVEFSVVMADGWSPYAFAVLRRIEEICRLDLLQGIACILPVHQIPGMENRQSRSTSEAGSCHVEIFTNSANIRVGIISMQHRVYVGAVFLVGYPNLGYILSFRLPA